MKICMRELQDVNTRAQSQIICSKIDDVLSNNTVYRCSMVATFALGFLPVGKGVSGRVKE